MDPHPGWNASEESAKFPLWFKSPAPRTLQPDTVPGSSQNHWQTAAVLDPVRSWNQCKWGRLSAGFHGTTVLFFSKCPRKNMLQMRLCCYTLHKTTLSIISLVCIILWFSLSSTLFPLCKKQVHSLTLTLDCLSQCWTVSPQQESVYTVIVSLIQMWIFKVPIPSFLISKSPYASKQVIECLHTK